MSTPTNPGREQPNTYAMQGISGDQELNRLQIQDRMITAAMGGVLPEQLDPTRFHRVLDIGCGAGLWLLEVARIYPKISLLIGIDANNKMLDYARMQAKALQVEKRVEFLQMDALLHMEFPDEYFDLVNTRFCMSWLRTWDWPKFLQECQRVARPGAVIRITETDGNGKNNSPALTQLRELTTKAFYQAGHNFREDNMIAQDLAHLLRQHGIQNVQTFPYAPKFRADTLEGQALAEDCKRAFRVLVPFLQKWTHMPDNYEDLYQQMALEVEQPNFTATWNLLTIWGTRLSTFSLPLRL
jgi:ubiquinone/menaquinone biosynthesis C-methylase UbiE